MYAFSSSSSSLLPRTFALNNCLDALNAMVETFVLISFFSSSSRLATAFLMLAYDDMLRPFGFRTGYGFNRFGLEFTGFTGFRPLQVFEPRFW